MNLVANKEIERIEVEKPKRAIAYEILNNDVIKTVSRNDEL